MKKIHLNLTEDELLLLQNLLELHSPACLHNDLLLAKIIFATNSISGTLNDGDTVETILQTFNN